MSLIYLVGPRACGKTTLGKALSEVLDVPYCDTDHHLCERLGMDVATMVERWGWEGFRSRESESLRLASEELAGRGVVATGGGMVLAEANRRYMREHGRVFFCPPRWRCWPPACGALRWRPSAPASPARAWTMKCARCWKPACPCTGTPPTTNWTPARASRNCAWQYGLCCVIDHHGERVTPIAA